MQTIVLARIDDRLIHGQVMTAWVQHTGANEIVIVDDAVAKDDFLKMVITGAVPPKMQATVLTVADAATYLNNGDEKKIIILAKGPAVYQQLLEAGVAIPAINLGGMGSNQDRSQLYKNISCSEEERGIFRKLIEQVEVFIQVVPNTEKVSLGKIIKGEG